MKLQIHFKTPDAVDIAIESALSCELLERGGDDTLCEDNFDGDEFEEKKRELEKFLEQWIEWGECVRIEFDTEANTAEILKI